MHSIVSLRIAPAQSDAILMNCSGSDASRSRSESQSSRSAWRPHRLPVATSAAARSQSPVEESFLILGWVANWRPLEIFLYDWWPLVRQRHLYRLLSVASVDSVPYRLEEPKVD